MTGPTEHPDKVQDRADALLASADRCYRLATGIMDPKTIEPLCRRRAPPTAS
jgi:hypothetical protein